VEIPDPTIDDANLIVVDESCLGNDGVIQGLEVTGNGLDFTWNGVSAPSQNAAGLSANEYTLEITDENGCTVSYGPIAVGGTVPPVIDVVPNNTTIDASDEVILNLTINPSSGSDVILWTPSAGLSCTNCLSPTASPSETTTYVVTVSNADGCVVSDTVTINVNNPCGEIFVPTIFTPNGDELHDQLCVLGGCVESISFEIFNRWGERVFKTENPEECWDGTFRGQKLNTGVFVYKVKGIRTDGSEFEDAGNVTISK
jgi:gliding motility-associated-like protein